MILKLHKNPEVMRLFGILVLLLVVFVIAVAIAASQLNGSFERSVMDNISAITGAITEKVPEAEGEIISQLLEMNPEHLQAGKKTLAKYGLSDRELLYNIDLLHKQHRHLLIFSVTCAGLLFIGLSVVFYLFLRRRYETVHSLTVYARNIAEGDDSLDIRDNEEGEFSVLKNEIYKITSMLREHAEKLQSDKKSLSDSIADISHQLKTPMTSLSVLSDLLENNPEEPVREQFLKRMRAQLDRMEWLITSLLTLAKLDAGTLELKSEIFTAKQLLHHVLTQLEIPLDIKNQQVNISGNEQMELTGDFEWTSEAFINILKNSIEHTPENGTLSITCEDNPIYAKIIITDQGKGIDRSDLPYVFNRFYKGKNARDDSVGIGLAMAYTLVKKQGGDIAVSSEPGRGSQFVITFYRQHI